MTPPASKANPIPELWIRNAERDDRWFSAEGIARETTEPAQPVATASPVSGRCTLIRHVDACLLNSFGFEQKFQAIIVETAVERILSEVSRGLKNGIVKQKKSEVSLILYAMLQA